MLAVPAFADFETVEKASADEKFEEVTATLVEDENTIEIATLEDLLQFAEDSKTTNFKGKTVVLTNDIDMSSVTDWEFDERRRRQG